MLVCVDIFTKVVNSNPRSLQPTKTCVLYSDPAHIYIHAHSQTTVVHPIPTLPPFHTNYAHLRNTDTRKAIQRPDVQTNDPPLHPPSSFNSPTLPIRSHSPQESLQPPLSQYLIRFTETRFVHTYALIFFSMVLTTSSQPQSKRGRGHPSVYQRLWGGKGDSRDTSN